MEWRIIRIWSLVNIAFLFIAILAPWAVVFSDQILSLTSLMPGWELLVNLVCTLFDLPLDVQSLLLIMAIVIAPAMIIYYAVINIRNIYLNRINPSLMVYKIIRILLSLMSLIIFYFSIGFNSYISWGYFLAVAAILSSAILEFVGGNYFQQNSPS
jgi:hypothetical protein